MMLAMVGRRVIHTLLQVRRGRQRDALLDDVLGYLSTGDESRIRAILARRRNVRLLPKILHQLLTVVQFDDPQPIYELLRICSMLDHLIRESASIRIDRRMRAVETLAEIRGPEIIAALDARIGDEAAEVSVAALSGLARMDALPPFPEIMRRLDIGRRHSERPYRMLFRSLAPGRARDLAVLLAEELLPAARILIVDALGECDEAIASKTLAVMTHDPSEDVRAAALRSLARLGRKDMAAVVMPRLADAAWTVRAQAVQTCAALGLRTSIPLIAQLLSDHSWWVRYRSAQALAQLGGEKVLSMCMAAGRQNETIRLVRAALYEMELAA